MFKLWSYINADGFLFINYISYLYVKSTLSGAIIRSLLLRTELRVQSRSIADTWATRHCREQISPEPALFQVIRFAEKNCLSQSWTSKASLLPPRKRVSPYPRRSLLTVVQPRYF